MFIKLKCYSLLLLENVSVNLKSYDILWLFSNLGLGSSFIIFHFFLYWGNLQLKIKFEFCSPVY